MHISFWLKLCHLSLYKIPPKEILCQNVIMNNGYQKNWPNFSFFHPFFVQISNISKNRDGIRAKHEVYSNLQRIRQRSGKAPMVEKALKEWFFSRKDVHFARKGDGTGLSNEERRLHRDLWMTLTLETAP